MTRCLPGALALGLLVAACAPERTQSSEPAVASGATAHLTGPVPNMEQTLYDIVDETGASIWQPYSAEPPTQAAFTLSIFGEPCGTSTPEDLDTWPGYRAVSCGGGGVAGYVAGPHPDLGFDPVPGSDLEACLTQRAQYPFAMISNHVRCWILSAFGASSATGTPHPIGLEAAPTAPGNRVFKRWEVTGGDGALLPCAQGQASLVCDVIARHPEDVGNYPLRIFIKLHYGPATYDFSGFFRPVDNLPTVNTMRAGRAVPIKFSLGGDRGLDIFATGSPSSRAISCQTGAPVDAIEETIAGAGQSSLSYDAASGQYTYVWKTESSWRGCRELSLAFNDGSTPKTARFQF